MRKWLYRLDSLLPALICLALLLGILLMLSML